MAEPSTEVFHRQTPANLVWTYFCATRPAFLSASVLSVFAALAFAWSQSGGLDVALALMTIVAVALFHSGANVLNDYFDARNGTDAINTGRIFPFSGGSRFIQNGVLSETQVLSFGVLLILMGVVLGLIIASQSGPVIVAVGFAGFLLAIFYSAPPCLACHGLGDLTIATCFGLLPTIGAVYVQTGWIGPDVVWLGMSLGCFVAAILWINSIPDIEADQQAGKITWPSRLNRVVASRMHTIWFLLGFGFLFVSPLGSSIVFAYIAAVPALMASVFAARGRLIPAIPLTIVTHGLVCILLIVDFLTA